jgi:hypothetical protein
MIELPPAVTEKLRRLEQSAADSEALMRLRAAALDQMQRSDLVNARNRLKTAPSPEAEAAVDATKKRIADTEADVAKHAARARTDAQTLAQLKSWIERQAPNKILQPVAPPPLRANRMNVGAVLEKTRARIAELSAELAVLQRAPLARADIEAAIKAHVAELAAQARPTIDRAGGLRITWPARATAVQTLAWLDPAALAAAIAHEIPPSVGKGKGKGVSESERASATKRLKSELLAIEREEEALVTLALANGVDAVRRPMADPRAVLQIEVTKATAKGAA